MRYERGHKDETRQRILDVAARLFCKSGITAVGIASIMKEAELTNGAFYAHFSSKEELVKEVMDVILDNRDANFFEENHSPTSFINQYLSPAHRDQCEYGCIRAALLSELIHHSKATRASFTAKTEKLLNVLSSQFVGDENVRNKYAVSIVSLLIGALQLSRVVTNKKLSNEILSGACQTALELIESKTVKVAL